MQREKFWYRVKYETFLTAQQIADLADPSKLVIVDRGATPLTPAQALETF